MICNANASDGCPGIEPENGRRRARKLRPRRESGISMHNGHNAAAEVKVEPVEVN